MEFRPGRPRPAPADRAGLERFISGNEHDEHDISGIHGATARGCGDMRKREEASGRSLTAAAHLSDIHLIG
jgi:hypothetical protein